MPSIGAPVQTPVVRAVTPPAGASTLSITTADNLPLVSINALAPNPTQAAKLADSAVTSLRSYLQSIAGAQKIPVERRAVTLPKRRTVKRG